ncbi:hypothetical protein GFS60_01853 [Rhodococcus sp. WAY2]|nr:hypothetical protein GFS60_01853 [Rhodococcus sp. WAY2]
MNIVRIAAYRRDDDVGDLLGSHSAEELLDPRNPFFSTGVAVEVWGVDLRRRY